MTDKTSWTKPPSLHRYGDSRPAVGGAEDASGSPPPPPLEGGAEARRSRLAHVDYLDEAIATVSEEIEGRLAPFAAQLTQLDTIPGINKRTAEVIIAELGVDMSCFPSDRHLARWAGICPGNNESAGKHKYGKTRKGNRWLRMTLIEAAAAATRTKDIALQARDRRVMRKRGHE